MANVAAISTSKRLSRTEGTKVAVLTDTININAHNGTLTEQYENSSHRKQCFNLCGLYCMLFITCQVIYKDVMRNEKGGGISTEMLR